MKTVIKLGKLSVENVECAKRPTVVVKGKEAVATSFIKAKETMEKAKEAYDDERGNVIYEAEEIQKQMVDLERERPENVKFATKNGSDVMVITEYKSKDIPEDVVKEIREYLPENIQERLVEEEYSIVLKGSLATLALRILTSSPEVNGDIKHHKDFSEKKVVKTTKEAYRVVQEVRKDLPKCEDIFKKLDKIAEPGMTVKVQ